jgi:hypothetical protein
MKKVAEMNPQSESIAKSTTVIQPGQRKRFIEFIKEKHRSKLEQKRRAEEALAAQDSHRSH